MYPTMQHPDLYVWDFWYYFEPESQRFHVFYLNADRGLVPSGLHHYESRVGHATTQDFVEMDWGNEESWNILKPPTGHWANTSIWSGDIVKTQTGYLMFYTSRNRETDDGMTQNIGVAHSHNLLARDWNFYPTRVQPKSNYLPRSLAGDLTIHAWRDPFLFRVRKQRQVFMLVSAKSSEDALGRNGAIALLQTEEENFTKVARGEREWEYLYPLSKPCDYAEMEVPQLYKSDRNNYELVFSSWAKYDFSPITGKLGGLQGVTIPNSWNFKTSGTKVGYGDRPVRVLIPEKDGLYACRIVPELNGEIVGFDIQSGGIRRSGIQTHLESLDRDFSDRVSE